MIRKFKISLALYFLLLMLFAVVTVTGVKAHSWYDKECCSDKDCAPVISKRVDAEGNLYVTTQHGTVRVPKTFERKQSRDNDEHACIIGVMLICYYVPFSS